MLFPPALPTLQPATFSPLPTLSSATMRISTAGPFSKSAGQSLSPIGQPFFSFRLGAAESDSPSYFAGLSYEVPVTLGVHLVSIRGDADLWEHMSWKNGGGTSLGVLAIFGPNSSYFGAGVAYAARIGQASGPTGPGVKLVFGGQPIPVIGYEFELIAGNRGAVGAVMATFKF